MQQLGMFTVQKLSVLQLWWMFWKHLCKVQVSNHPESKHPDVQNPSVQSPSVQTSRSKAPSLPESKLLGIQSSGVQASIVQAFRGPESMHQIYFRLAYIFSNCVCIFHKQIFMDRSVIFIQHNFFLSDHYSSATRHVL